MNGGIHVTNIYAMSDLHEELDLFKETLRLVNLSENNKLVLLGDYGNIHSQDLSFLYFIRRKQNHRMAKQG